MAVAETINKTMIPVTRKFACLCPSFFETRLRPALSSTYPRTLRERGTTPGNRLNSLKHQRLWPSLGANLHQGLGHQDQPQDLVHSETMLPTTCPHLLFGSIALNATTQAMPVTRRNRVSECSRSNSTAADRTLPFGCLLSADPFRTGAWSLQRLSKLQSSPRWRSQRTPQCGYPDWTGGRARSRKPRLPMLPH
jgi:hypothetical protein